MALAGDSILVTPGSGATVATETVSGKEHQVVMLADHSGHLRGSRMPYFFQIPSQVHVASANTVHWDLFNADASLVVRVFSIQQIPNIVTAVTGVAFAWKIARTTAVGTGGSALTAWKADIDDTDLDADITLRSKPTGGATESDILLNYNLHGEETNAGTQMFAGLSAGGVANLVPWQLRPPHSEKGLVLRQNQGLRCVQITSNVNGNTGWLIGFTVE
jgi:hypothetical protein